MKALYFKHKHRYINDTEAKHFSYLRITDEGKITVVSINKRTISNPKSLSITQNGLEKSSEEEFEKYYNDII